MVLVDDVKAQLKVMERLEAEGARFVPVRPASKQPVGAGWQHNPYTADAVADHLYAGGNVGLLAGEPSNGICVLDLDTRFPKFLSRFPKFAQTPRILRDGAPERGKVLIRIKEMVPPPRKWKNLITNMPEAEWLSMGNHALLPPSVHPNGNYFYWLKEEEPILELSLATMNGIWQQWTGTLLVPTPESEGQGPTVWFPDPHAPKRTSRATPPSPTRTIMPPSDPRDTIRRRFDMVRYACQQLNTTSVRESATEFRVLGQGGLLINVQQQIWNTFGSDGSGKTGGDCFDLVSYLHFGNVRPSGQQWKEVLRMAAEYVGIRVERGEDRAEGRMENGEQRVERTAVSTSQPPTGPLRSPRSPLSLPMGTVWNLEGSARLVWGGWLEAGLMTLIGGVPNVGKSPLLLSLVAGYLRGVWPDGTPVPEFFAGRNVVYYLPEGFASQTRFLRDWGLDEATVNRVHVPFVPGAGSTPKPEFAFSLDEVGLPRLQAVCADAKPALIVIDGLRAAMVGEESSSTDVKAFFDPLIHLAHQYDAVLLITHHLTKGAETRSRSGELPSMDWYRGSGDMLRPCRSAWIVDRPNPNDLNTRRITLVKAAEGPQQVTMAFYMVAPADGLTFNAKVPLPPAATKKEEAARFYLDILELDGPLTHEEVVEAAQAAALDVSAETLRQARMELSKAGKIVQQREGQTTSKWALMPS